LIVSNITASGALSASSLIVSNITASGALSASNLIVSNITASGAAKITCITDGSNIKIGHQALSASTSDIQDNISIGSYAGSRITANTENIFIGAGAFAYAKTPCNYNIVLGSYAGESQLSGSNNILIGYDIDLPVAGGSNQLNIGNLIYGSGSAFGSNETVCTTMNVGISVSNPGERLTVNGNISASGYIKITNVTASGTISSSGLYAPFSSSLVPSRTGSMFYSGSKLWIYTGTGNAGGLSGWQTASLGG
jgi:hypothetical protein